MDIRQESTQLIYKKLDDSTICKSMSNECKAEFASQLEYSILTRAIRASGASYSSYMSVPEFFVYYENDISHYATQLSDDNPRFMQNIARGEYLPAIIIYMKPQDINNSQLQKHLDKLQRQDNISVVMRTNANFKCRKCHSPCSIQPVMLRASDEAANSILICPTCGALQVIQ